MGGKTGGNRFDHDGDDEGKRNVFTSSSLSSFFLIFFPLTINQKTSQEPEKKTLTRLEMEKKKTS